MPQPSPIQRLTESIEAIDRLHNLSNRELSRLICEHLMGDLDIMSPQFALLEVVRERLEKTS